MGTATVWRTEQGTLRAPWQIAVFGVVVAASSIFIGGMIYALIALTPAVGWARIARIPVAEWIQVACLLASTSITARLLGTPDIWKYVGLDRDAWRPRHLARGAALGAAVIAVPALAIVAGGISRFETATSGESALFMIWSAMALLVPAALSEEVLFRGLAFSAVRAAIGTGRAILVTSVCFGLAHLFNPDPTVVSVIAVMVAGFLLAMVRVVTGSLAAAFVAHFAVNFTQLALLHAPVSGQAFETPGYRLIPGDPAWLTGGSWGPEGGAAAMAAMLIATFVLKREGRW